MHKHDNTFLRKLSQFSCNNKNLILDCPDEYHPWPGSINIHDLRTKVIEIEGKLWKTLSSIKECGKFCDKKATKCKAFEWDPCSRRCVLLKIAITNGPQYKNYLFCSKGEHSCQIRYNLHIKIIV